MIRNNVLSLFVFFILVGLCTSCREDETCASVINELLESGCNSKQLAAVMGVPETVIEKPKKHNFSEADSILLFSLFRTYNETGKLPENLYQLYNKNKYNQVLTVIENFRKEEIKSNEVFVNNLCQKIIEIQKQNLNDFIENEVNSFKSLRFIWKSQEEINQELSEVLPRYVDEITVAKIYNDSCASYFNYISRFRENGVKQYITKSVPQTSFQTIDNDVRGFMPNYQFDNSSSHVTYQILATIDRAQDILFAPINWLLELLPNWLMITISILLLILLIVCIFTGHMHLTVLDLILLVISVILIFWGDPYSEIRMSMKNQIQVYYEEKIEDGLTNLNTKTNIYYDNLIKNLKTSNSKRISHKSSPCVQTNVEENVGGDSRTNLEKINEGSSSTGDQSSSEVSVEADDGQRNEAPFSGGD